MSTIQEIAYPLSGLKAWKRDIDDPAKMAHKEIMENTTLPCRANSAFVIIG